MNLIAKISKKREILSVSNNNNYSKNEFLHIGLVDGMSQLYNIKLVMLGEGGVGKTSLVLRYTKNMFDSSYKKSIGATFAVKRMEIESNPVNLLIWDLAGQPSFDAIRTHFYNGAQAALLIFDLTRRKTFEKI